MKSVLVACLAVQIGLAGSLAMAQGTPEPQVKQTVLEDDAVRIDELRVRGQVQRITVTPKAGGMRAYEIVPAGAGRDPSQGPPHAQGTAGQRVWSLLRF
jgi:hypothetical protein